MVSSLWLASHFQDNTVHQLKPLFSIELSCQYSKFSGTNFVLKKKIWLCYKFPVILTPPSQKPNHCSLEKFQKSEGTIDAASL